MADQAVRNKTPVVTMPSRASRTRPCELFLTFVGFACNHAQWQETHTKRKARLSIFAENIVRPPRVGAKCVSW